MNEHGMDDLSKLLGFDILGVHEKFERRVVGTLIEMTHAELVDAVLGMMAGALLYHTAPTALRMLFKELAPGTADWYEWVIRQARSAAQEVREESGNSEE